LQSTGQAKVLQEENCTLCVQRLPPYAAAMTTELERFLEPVPQEAEQGVQAEKPESLQLIGQAKVLQVVVEVKVGQPAPPKRAAVTTERVLVLEPVPQDLVHTP
jgi:hypothetical protein